MKKPRIAVVGPGVVGKATGRAFIDKGYEVAFIGRSPEQIEKLRSEGYEAYGRNDLINGDYDFDITMLTVPTPTINGKISLDAMELATIDLARRIKNTKKYQIVVVKSTCPPGTTEDLVIKTLEEYSGKKVGKDFGACMNPEYLREVSAYEDAVNPWAVVIGEYDEKSGELLEAAYEGFDAPIYHCSLKEAEMQKYVHNLFNAAKVTFFNEMREIAKAINVDADKIFKYTILSCEGLWNAKYGTKDKGPYSGACLPKDTKAFLNFAKRKGLNADLLASVIAVNDAIKEKQLSAANHAPTNGVANGKKNRVAIELQREAEQNREYTL